MTSPRIKQLAPGVWTDEAGGLHLDLPQMLAAHGRGQARRNCVKLTYERQDPMMIDELYDALIEAGASEGKAKSAARALANYENRFHKVETDLSVLKWMVGANIALTVATLFKAFNS